MRRRIILLVTVAAVMLTTMALSAGSAFAQPPSDPNENGNPSCFGVYARSEPGPPPGPGDFVSGAATTLAEPGPETPGSGTDEVARDIGLAQHVRQDVCPANQSLQQ